MSQYVEATLNGVNILNRNSSGEYEHVAILTYEDAVKRLDSGEYDDLLDFGFAIHGAISEAGDKGWFDFTAQHHVTMWRWLIAAVFIIEMKRKNGTVAVAEADGSTSQAVVYSNGRVGIPIYPLSERLAMANNVEGALIQRYGIEQGTECAITFYSAMMDAQAGTLTSKGNEILASLHDSFISALEASSTTLIPATH